MDCGHCGNRQITYRSRDSISDSLSSKPYLKLFIKFVVCLATEFRRLFQSKFSKECDLVLSLSIISILSFPYGYPIAAYICHFWGAETPISYIYLNINQLDALNFIMSLCHASTCFERMCSSSGGQNCTVQPLVSSHL